MAAKLNTLNDTFGATIGVLADYVQENSVVPGEHTIVELRRLNGAIAALFARHDLVADVNGVVTRKPK